MANTRWPTRRCVESPKRDGKERLGRGVDLEHGHVGRFVLADQPAFVALAVEQRDLDLAGAVDDVEVGQDVAARVEHRAGAGPFGRDFDVEKEEGVAAHALGVDVHHAAIDVLVDRDVDQFLGRQAVVAPAGGGVAGKAAWRSRVAAAGVELGFLGHRPMNSAQGRPNLLRRGADRPPSTNRGWQSFSWRLVAFSSSFFPAERRLAKRGSPRRFSEPSKIRDRPTRGQTGRFSTLGPGPCRFAGRAARDCCRRRCKIPRILAWPRFAREDLAGNALPAGTAHCRVPAAGRSATTVQGGFLPNFSSVNPVD